MFANLIGKLVGRQRENSRALDAQHEGEFALRWRNDGYLMLENLFSAGECDDVLAEVDRYSGPRRHGIDSLITVDVLHGPHSGKCMRACRAPDEVFDGPFKINNLFTESPAVQTMVFAPSLTRALRSALGVEPLAINSLNFRYGSQQPAHIDSWYMPPPKANSMAVASICLEDTDPEAGPVFYYPGSHLIPPYRFSHGRLDAIADEMPACNRYIAEEIERRGLERRQVLGRKGDVFIWHCQLLHGGLPIVASRKTRASLVVHYWGCDSVPASKVRTGMNGGKMLDRDYVSADGVGISAS